MAIPPLQPMAPSDVTDGYYAKVDLVIANGGQEQYDAEMRLDPGGLVADPAVVQLVIGQADNTVEAIAYKVGLSVLTTGAGAGHAVAPDEVPVFGECSIWASRWARAQAHALQPETNNDPGDRDDVEGSPPPDQVGQAEAGFVGARREAERKIKEILTAKFQRQSLASVTNTPSTIDDIIAVGWNDPCGPLPTGIDSRTVAR